ncbi:hypothetical protein LEP1GSC151_2241 [Leptospira interrogans serovar Grippotyphosa str. LT2186]|uniref:Uncharacterized protein n=2 Tax=Leptospira interrogans TaxID=173 RepID=M3H9B8_LEPIR|nr:hypothetical protein LEP1GSC151_2241 [Leptospira interrogans serovar Grippotyphosa str. LT2186]EMM79419.1 hypothetical protein LEP1GSC037_3790 [Leptospira interrogans str. 2006001854]
MTIDKIGGIGGSGYEPKRTAPVKKRNQKKLLTTFLFPIPQNKKLPKQSYKRKFKL